MDKKKENISYDALVYLIFKILEGVLGVATLSLYTKVFTESEMGIYSIINTTLIFIVGFSSTWITGSIFRFLSNNEHKNKRKIFISTIYITYFVMVLAVSILFLSIYYIVQIDFVNARNAMIIVLAYIMNVLLQINLSMTTSLRKVKLNILISLVTSVLKLGLFIIAIKVYNVNVFIIFTINLMIDVIVNSLVVVNLKIYKAVRLKYFDKELIKTFFKYGVAFFGTVTVSMILNISDRYLILNFFDARSVGIYTANYSIISTAFLMINYSITRASMPLIMKLYNNNEKEKSYELINNTVKYYLLLVIPIVFGVLALSTDISKILFKESYVEASSIMVWVTLGYIFNFLLDFANKAYELNKKTNKILRNSMIAGACNIVLNIFLMRIYGYKIAGVVTFISYFIYFIISYAENNQFYNFNYGILFYGKSIISSMAMFLVIKTFKIIFGINLILLLVYVCMGCIIYVTLIYYLGLIKNEIDDILKIKLSDVKR